MLSDNENEKKLTDWPGEQLLIKMWETLMEKGIGSLLTPWQIKREGRARIEVRRQEQLMLAQVEVDADKIRAGRMRFDVENGNLSKIDNKREEIKFSRSSDLTQNKFMLDFQTLANASKATNQTEAIRKEININKAIIYAEECLSNDSNSPLEDKIDDDWLFMWRDYAEKTSTEDLQKLWGAILAGEIKSPGKYSLRTLDFLRRLSKNEAEKIAKLGSFAIDDMIILIKDDYLQDQGLSLRELMKMQEIGILSGIQTGNKPVIEYKTTMPEIGKFIRPFRSNGKALIVKHDDPNKLLRLNVYLFTDVGAQLLTLGNFLPDIQYLRLVGQNIVSQGFNVELADWIEFPENSIAPGNYGQFRNAEKIDV